MKKKFKHNLVWPTPDLETEIINGGRHYIVREDVKFPSVTTILDGTADKTWLQEWKARVGEEEAERISNRAKNRGTLMHEMAEDYTLNKELKPVSPIATMVFQPIKKKLDAHVDEIMFVEGCLWSENLRVAGRCDLIACWDGVPAIIDYKTASKEKCKSHITDYFLQTSLYSYMFWERTNILVDDIVILISVEDDPEAQVFRVKASDYLQEAKGRIKAYEKASLEPLERRLEPK
jgi:genome maintenance exonuclease 1